MDFSQSRGWTPTILVISADSKIVGICPLMTKKMGIRVVKFLHDGWFSPDLVFEEQYREIGVNLTLDFLLKGSRCDLIDLTLPMGSPNLKILKERCRDGKICLSEYVTNRDSEMGHRIVPAKNTWDEFSGAKGWRFRRKWKKKKHKLDQAGSWKIVRIENDNMSDAIKKILEIERTSWKRAKRIQRKEKIDPDIPVIWEGSQHAADTVPGFNWGVWFLELDGKPIAYQLVLQYKEVAYFVKTSYNERYKRLSPGAYVINSAIRDMCNRSEVKEIDFLTDLPSYQTWTSKRLPRVRIAMTQGFVLSTLIRFIVAVERYLPVTYVPRLILERLSIPSEILRA